MTLIFISIAAILLFAVLGRSIWRKRQLRKAHSQRLLRLRRNLLGKTLGNENTVKSLFDYERGRGGSLSLEELMQAAIDRWEHDNR